MSNLDDNKKYILAWSILNRIGAVRFKKIEAYFENIKSAWLANRGELILAGLPEKLVEEIILKRNEIDLDLELEKLAQEKIGFITWHDDQYPKLLKDIYDPPFLLYYKGRFCPEEDDFSLAVVGTRKVSSYGKQATINLTKELTQAGLVIVSGLALGVDGLAHEACLEMGGRTIAVIGSGLNSQNIYPSYNRYLIEKILAGGGLVLSEFPIGTQPLPHNFPQRNRIVSGLSKGVLVIEAPESSGALLTAKNALDQGREVMAVPGSIYNLNSTGTNKLIKLGAKLVSSAEDVLETLDLGSIKEYVKVKKDIPLTDSEKKIYNILSDEEMHVDEVVRKSGANASEVNGILTLLEIKGMARNLGNMRWVRG